MVRAGGFDPPASCSQGTRATRLRYALTLTLILPLIAALVIQTSPAYADDAEPWIALPAKEAARLAARDAELDAAQAQVTALEAVVAAQRRQIDAQGKIIALQDEEIARRERITALADEERDIHKGRGDRIAETACKEIRVARMTGYAATGAAVGSAAFPGVGTVVGGAIGAAVGYFMPCR